jgi:hypothetical protein
MEIGMEDFKKAKAEKTLGRPVSTRKPGRPKRAENKSGGISLSPSRFRVFPEMARLVLEAGS